MIVVHHLENSRSQRILWTLEELGLEYEIKKYARNPKTNLAPKELKDVHPLGKSPVITDKDFTLAESGAIIEYLIETYGNGRLIPPAGSAERNLYRYWLHFAEGSLMPLLVMKLIFHKTTEAPVPFFIRPISKAIANQVNKGYLDPSLRAQLAFMEEQLSKTPWFAGKELSAADIQMSYPIEAAASRTDFNGRYPNLADFLVRIRKRDAFQNAIKRGGNYSFPKI